MASWNHDGTQDPGPPPLMSDPLSGLVTGGRYDGDSVRIRVVEPAAPDIEAVRTAMESVLDENSELRIDPPSAPRRAAKPPVPLPAKPADKTPTPPTGIPAPALRLGATPREIPAQHGLEPARKRWSPAVAAVGLLLLVFAVLLIVMLASLIDSISSIFS